MSRHRAATDAGATEVPAPAPVWSGRETVAIVVPVHNEERVLDASIRRLHSYLDETFPIEWSVTVVENASTDSTWEIACRLASEFEAVEATRVPDQGRGGAVRAAWTASTADVLVYMDVDLSTGLDALLPLVAPLISGHSDLSVGSRQACGARVVRGPRREIISRSYNFLVRRALRTRLTDAQCGFKAIHADVAGDLLPLVVDDHWFFDTELIVLAERRGLRVSEVPVNWVDDPRSSVDVLDAALKASRGIVRMMRTTADSPASTRADG